MQPEVQGISATVIIYIKENCRNVKIVIYKTNAP